jgi:hypothetical protein
VFDIRHYLKLGSGYIKRVNDHITIVIERPENYEGYSVKLLDSYSNKTYEIGYTKTINQAKRLGNGYLVMKDIKERS